MQAKHWNICD